MYKNPLQLNQPLGSSYPADEDDVRAVKSALLVVGEYPETADRESGYTDDALFDGLKRFQKKRGLHPDGIAKPGGPTETTLSAALADKALSRPQRRAGKNGSRRPSQAARQKQSVFGIANGTGEGQVNRPHDVTGTKRALAWAGYYPKEKAQNPKSTPDEDMRWGLWRFQQDFGLKQDGFMRPGGETAQALNTLITPLVLQAVAAEGDPPQEEEAPDHPSEPPPANDEDGDTDHERKCQALQAEADRLREEEAHWREAAMFLNADIAQVDEADRSRYISLVSKLTAYDHKPERGVRPDFKSFMNLIGSAEARGPGGKPGKRPDQSTAPAPTVPPDGGKPPNTPVPPMLPPHDGGAPREDDKFEWEEALDEILEPSWFDEIRKYRREAQDGAFEKMMEFSRERTKKITEGENQGCFIEQK